jgi:hypothetical protein
MKGIDIEALKRALDEDLANPNGYWNKLKRKDEIKKSRFIKLEQYLNSHDFKSIIDRLIKEHGEEWEDRCWKKGYEPYPNNKFGLLFDYIEENYSNVDNYSIPQDFLSGSYFIKGYWFTVYCGQGCFYRIYDNDLNIILQV